LTGDVVDRLGKTKIRRNKHGKFQMWRKPDPNMEYIVCVDSAGGIKQSQKDQGREPDPSCIDVFEHVSGRQVAQWHGHLDYDMIGDLVELIGNLYGRCVACVEANNHGHTVIADLKRKHYPMFEAHPGEPGWLTTKKTKPLMVDSLIRMARDGQVQIMCAQTVSEMRTFVEEGGKYNAASGCHDERVDTAGMACEMMTIMPRKLKELQNESGIVNWKNKNRNPSGGGGGYKEVYVS